MRRSYAAAIYGSILVTSLVGALRYTENARQIALTVLGTSLVFWLAHAWSEAIGERIATGADRGLERFRELALHEWPMVEAGALPFLALALAWAGVFSARAGSDLAMAIGIAQLFAWAVVGARRAGRSWPRALTVGTVDCCFGLAIVGLEILVHH